MSDVQHTIALCGMECEPVTLLTCTSMFYLFTLKGMNQQHTVTAHDEWPSLSAAVNRQTILSQFHSHTQCSLLKNANFLGSASETVIGTVSPKSDSGDNDQWYHIFMCNQVLWHLL